MIQDIADAFEQCGEDSHQFGKFVNPPHRRPDIAAFILLDKLVPGEPRDMVSAAEHNQIWLDVDADELAKVATMDDIRNLCHCGVFYDSEFDCLGMFV